MHDDPTVLLKKQLIWLVLATIAGIAMMVNLEALREYALLARCGFCPLTCTRLIPGIGVEVNGARRWMDFGIMRLQVSEIGKLGLIFSMAHYLATYRRDFNRVLKGYFYPCVLLAIFCSLIILEPDYGTAFLCGAVGGCLMFLAGVRLKFLIPCLRRAFALFGGSLSRSDPPQPHHFILRC